MPANLLRAAALALLLARPAAASVPGGKAAPAPLLPALTMPAADPRWPAALSMARSWFSEPAHLNAAAALDPYLVDLAALDPDRPEGKAALGPLFSALDAAYASPEERRDVSGRLARLPFLGPVDRLDVLHRLSHARRDAAGAAVAALARLEAALDRGEATPEDLAALPDAALGLRLYGPEAEEAAARARAAAARLQTRRVEAAADRILREHFKTSYRREDLPPSDAEAPGPSPLAPRHPAFHREAALRGSARAALGLGVSYERSGLGWGEPRKSYAWYARAAVLGHPAAAEGLLRVARRVGPESLAAVENDAAWLLAKLALAGAAAKAAASEEKPLSNFVKRALTALVLVPGVILSIHWGPVFFSMTMTLLAYFSLLEYGEMLKAGKRGVQPFLAALFGGLLAMAPAVGFSLPFLLAAAAASMVLREVFRKDHSFERAALSLFGAVFFGFLPAHLALVRALPGGEAFTLMTFAGVWASDTMAYLVGKRWGRRRVAPVLSPKKTWEGSLAGFAAAFLVALGFWAAVPGLMSLPVAAAAGFILGAVGQLGGFASSMVKRALGVKDSGTMLPGHGGLIDRFDALLLAAPFLYYLLRLAL